VVSKKPEWLQEFVPTKSTPALDAVANEELHCAAQRLSVYLGWTYFCDDTVGPHFTDTEYNEHTVSSCPILNWKLGQTQSGGSDISREWIQKLRQARVTATR
jgi:hypothetical protein